ncbi:alpha-amylase [Pseudoflavonifractor sp. 60]|uniref:alpha-amylase family glycosyl hydrolase n=1 Tax=Pseudoflavonifractor sp. 60 TaxID=2304576 RepID=UPI001371A6DB|nr:alpha-amylase family glycosyl hydrolase [Pseudoflavonifractor sp. 60]NBI66380.1 alpha-amylase [Pseudoflavonifractor sp. 60]
MADQTHKGLRNQTIYSVFVRNHTPEGTFQGVRRDLPRIRDLGADIVWLMPIHPIGERARKGTLGSPYAIRDYRAVNPEFGTLEDFQQLVEDIHALGMKCIIDVVYNHTSPDSVLAGEHPEWFYHKADGSFGNRVGDWSDIIDLDYGQRALWDYQIETLKYWASMVDGFRCDVAPLVPLDFWKTARRQVEEVRPGCIWLAETVEPSFITFLRRAGYDCLSDSQAYEAFDICYDYDIYHTFRDCLEGKLPLEQYAQALNRQETTYPGNYVKLRCLENHDQLRAAFLLPDQGALLNWTAFLFFLKGTALIYGGQEAGCTHLPSLFDRDPVDWSGPDRSELFRRLCAFKKNPLLTDSVFQVRALPHGVLYGTHFSGQRRLVGVFSTRGTQELVSVDVPDGIYTDLFSGGNVEVKHGKLSCQGRPVAVETAE